jgi:hypothetical protein
MTRYLRYTISARGVAARLHRGLYTAALVSTNEPSLFWQNYHLQKISLGDSHCPRNTYIDFNES